jgi:hypothetical protein
MTSAQRGLNSWILMATFWLEQSDLVSTTDLNTLCAPFLDKLVEAEQKKVHTPPLKPTDVAHPTMMLFYLSTRKI